MDKNSFCKCVKKRDIALTKIFTGHSTMFYIKRIKFEVNRMNRLDARVFIYAYINTKCIYHRKIT